MLKLAIIGASYLQLPLIEKAKEMGYETHVFAWAANDVGEKCADFFYPISIVEKDEILTQCRKIGICGICSIASDLASITVNYVANKMGLAGNSMACTFKSTNKYLMRNAFNEYGDPSPKSVLVDAETDLTTLSLKYPVIVKPIDRSGSRGIYKLESPEKLWETIRASMSQGFEKKALIEEYVEGQEYSVEGISYHGEHHILTVTLKHTTGAPHFIEKGHVEPAPIDSATFERVKAVVIHALNTLGIENSASHSEVKIAEDGTIKIIEIGGRMGGDCIGSDLVHYSTGIDYVRTVIQVACGIRPDLCPDRVPMPVEVRFIFSDKDVEEMKALQQMDKFLKLVFFFPEYLGKATDSSNRAGCYLLKV